MKRRHDKAKPMFITPTTHAARPGPVAPTVNGRPRMGPDAADAERLRRAGVRPRLGRYLETVSVIVQTSRGPVLEGRGVGDRIGDRRVSGRGETVVYGPVDDDGRPLSRAIRGFSVRNRAFGVLTVLRPTGNRAKALRKALRRGRATQIARCATSASQGQPA